MLQSCGDTRLATESSDHCSGLEVAGTRHQIGPNLFDCDLTTRPAIARGYDAPHAHPRDLFSEGVVLPGHIRELR